jgi:uncharacterized membrane protein
MSESAADRWRISTAAAAAHYTMGLADAQERSTAFMETMHDYKRAATPEQDYEELRERYVTGEIDLEEFAASVVAILKRGL